MSLQRQVLIWAACSPRCSTLLYLLGSTVTPFAAGLALGYLLDPVVHAAASLGMSRLVASLLILALFILVLALLLVIVAPILANQLVGFAQRLPGYRYEAANARGQRGPGARPRNTAAPGSIRGASGARFPPDQIQKDGRAILSPRRAVAAGGWTRHLERRRGADQLLLAAGRDAGRRLLYPGRLGPHGARGRTRCLPLDHREIAARDRREIDKALAGFIRGQSLVCLFLGMWYSFGLSLIGLDFGFLIGVIGGRIELRALRRFAHCAGAFARRRAGAGLAEPEDCSCSRSASSASGNSSRAT